jgi:hypothetical protein
MHSDETAPPATAQPDGRQQGELISGGGTADINIGAGGDETGRSASTAASVASASATQARPQPPLALDHHEQQQQGEEEEQQQVEKEEEEEEAALIALARAPHADRVNALLAAFCKLRADSDLKLMQAAHQVNGPA